MGIFRKRIAVGIKSAAEPAPTLPPSLEDPPFAPPTPGEHVPASTAPRLSLNAAVGNRPGVRPDWMIDGMPVTVYEGSDTLEVVGESHRQDNLWNIVGVPKTSQSIRHRTLAVLVPEAGNQYDHRHRQKRRGR